MGARASHIWGQMRRTCGARASHHGTLGQNYPDHVRTSASNVTKYWLPPPILKENEATNTIFLEKSPGRRTCPFSSAGWQNFSIIFGLGII